MMRRLHLSTAGILHPLKWLFACCVKVSYFEIGLTEIERPAIFLLIFNNLRKEKIFTCMFNQSR